jgi:nucleoside-diphosphate-sugar epimerase
LCSYNDGKEKSPAALCRKVVEGNGEIEVWGNGKQIRSYLYIDDLLDAIDLLLQHNIKGPINVGNEHYITIGELAQLIIDISKKDVQVRYIPGPIGVNARTSDNTLIEKLTGWKPQTSLEDGINKLYYWIKHEINKGKIS